MSGSPEPGKLCSKYYSTTELVPLSENIFLNHFSNRLFSNRIIFKFIIASFYQQVFQSRWSMFTKCFEKLLFDSQWWGGITMYELTSKDSTVISHGFKFPYIGECENDDKFKNLWNHRGLNFNILVNVKMMTHRWKSLILRWTLKNIKHFTQIKNATLSLEMTNH